jgi:hypothetical protein
LNAVCACRWRAVAINKNKVFHSKDLFERVCVVLMVWYDDVCKGLKKEKCLAHAVFLKMFRVFPANKKRWF